LGFSTFNRKIFRISKFRAENFSGRELSARKILGGKKFSASVPGAISGAEMCAGTCAPSVMRKKPGVFPDFAAIGRKFLERTDFWAGKIVGVLWGIQGFAGISMNQHGAGKFSSLSPLEGDSPPPKNRYSLPPLAGLKKRTD